MLARKEDFVPIIKLIVQDLIMPDYLQILPNINIPRISNSVFSLKLKIVLGKIAVLIISCMKFLKQW